MADGIDWKSEFDKLERRCAVDSNRAGRDLAAFGVGAVVTSAAAYGLYRWKKAKGCACQLTEGTNGNDAANGNGNANSSNGNGNGNGNGSNGHGNGSNGNSNGSNGNGSNGKATLNLPNLPNQGGMAPGDS